MAETAGYVAVRRVDPPAMVLLRADLGAAKLKAALKPLGLAVPAQRRIDWAGEHGAAWMSPDELLLFGPARQGPELAADLALRLEGVHHLAADVSDLRVLWGLEGAAAREVLAKLTPADAFGLPLGEIRRSRLGQVAAAFWLPAEGAARVLAFRSVAPYVDGLLDHAARRGSEVFSAPR